MNKYSIIIDEKQKALIAKALGAFSQMLLGQTAEETESSKRLAKAIAGCKDDSFGTVVNNLTK